MIQFLGFGFALIVFLAFCLFQYFHGRERAELMRGIMAKNLQEYEYYTKKFKKDIAEVKDLREEARKERGLVRKKGEELIERELEEEDEGGGEKSKPEFESFEESELIPEKQE